MPTHDVTFDGKDLHVAGHAWSVEYPIADACLVNGVVVVIYDYMAGPRHAQFRNAAGFDVTGRKLWTVEHPTNTTADAYVEIMQESPLILWNYACYRCTIDPATGRLIDAMFTK